MVEIIFIIVGIVLAAIGIAAAHESEEDFLGVLLFSLPGIVSVIIGIIIMVNHLVMSMTVISGSLAILAGTVAFAFVALWAYTDEEGVLMLYSIPCIVVIICGFMILTDSISASDLPNPHLNADVSISVSVDGDTDDTEQAIPSAEQ